MPDMLFQQDGATCHTARATMTKLRADFGEQFISRSGPVNWPPRSCDLTPLDFFLWGYVKAHVYMDKPATTDTLNTNTINFFEVILLIAHHRMAVTQIKYEDLRHEM